MKKLIISILFIASLVNAQNHRTYYWTKYLTGIDTAYTDTIPTASVMGVDHWAADTSGSDSVALTINFKTATDKLGTYVNSYTTTDTWAVTSDSSLAKRKLTEYAIDNDPWCFYEIISGNNNKKASAVKVIIQHKNTSERVR